MDMLSLTLTLLFNQMNDTEKEIISSVRDINLSLVLSNFNITITNRIRDEKKKLKKLSKYLGLYPNKKVIKYIKQTGGVLGGSRALRCYNIENVQMLDRDSDDWDFIITPNMAYQIFDKFNVKYDLVSKFISIKKQLWWAHPAYSNSYRVGPINVNIIIVDNLPDYEEIGGFKITSLPNIINEKVNLIKTLNGNDKIKHVEDLRQFIIKYNLAKENKNEGII